MSSDHEDGRADDIGFDNSVVTDQMTSNAPTGSLFGQSAQSAQNNVDHHDPAELNDSPVVSRTSTKSFHTAPLESTPDTKRRSTNIGNLYDEIEPEYKRLTLGDLDFDKLDFNELSSDWQQLKGAEVPSKRSAENSSTNNDVPKRAQIPEQDKESTMAQIEQSVSVSPTRRATSKNAEEDELVQPEVLVTTARRPRVVQDDSIEDDRPDAAKIEDLKRFAYAHGSARSASTNSKIQHKKRVANVKAEPLANQQEHHRDSTPDADIKVPVAPGETLSFSRKSKVSKILGLKMDSPQNDNAQQKQASQTSDSDLSDGESPVVDDTQESSRASPFTSAPPTRSSTTTRSKSLARMQTSSDSLVLSDQTAKRALLIKAAHLEVCNHLTRNSRTAETQADGTHVILLSGLSFWGRLTEQEKLKSQPTIIEIMHRYSHESHFPQSSLDQVVTKGGNSGLVNDAAVTLDPKSDLPLSTDIDNEVGRSKAAAEYIIERLSEKLGSTTFHDDGDNVFKVPIKGKSPLSRIEGDKEWRLVQDAVSAHALGRGYQVQMGDGPEDITKPWQVRQKGDLKDALTSFTRWPSASELVWVKVNRLGVDS
ncbi:protein of unknown function [Taphrina deformans PYCC 5710]|uniref:Uncharacterized protein n=1 Tax=Taphrina deformans (strain PYCC 5710 / ATCC 11124 / CBS 356.35 / IMI 108563 / JCM 9778 / NBRC 8474) TaxID=1097556 RepID=R4XMB7_TAPDE|nr:protein of unknown function [Taphrina deformans PYCC 5710]|eukprot:CCG84445.1 protein of unknown function [Taphrina deformans PYCC 5710]